MKNKLLFSLLFSLAALIGQAQTIPNFSFENWVQDTNYLDLTLANPALLDTAVSTNPVGWTTVNEVTNSNTFHHKVLVNQNGSGYVGSSSIRLTSDSLTALINNIPIAGSVSLNFVCPGFAVVGNFPINLSNFVSLGSTFNPALLPGAGIPVSSRIAKIGGYMQYAPQGGDSAYVVAILRQGTTVVATATYTRNTTDAGFTYFEAPFVYQNCMMPDTLVYTLSSGNPYSISGVAFGSPSGLHVGSSLLIDSIFYGGVEEYGIAYPLSDSATTRMNTPVIISVTANDSSCSDRIFTLAQSVSPKHGTITIQGDSIVYTPTTGYYGLDTFAYSEAVGTGPVATAPVYMKVLNTAGVSEIIEAKTLIYPNPASTKLHIMNSNPAVSELKVFDMLGDLIKNESITSSIDLSAFSNGLYIIQFSNAEGKMISTSRFTVVK